MVTQWCRERALPVSVRDVCQSRKLNGQCMFRMHTQDNAGEYTDITAYLPGSDVAHVDARRQWLDELRLLFEHTGYISTAGGCQQTWGQFEVIDFAGQMEYFASHKLYLSGLNAIFLALAPIAEYGE